MAKLGVGAEALNPGDLADQLGRGQRPAAREREQLRRLAPHERLDLALEPVGLAGQLAAAADELATDPHLRGLAAPPGSRPGSTGSSQGIAARHLRGGRFPSPPTDPPAPGITEEERPAPLPV
jgi:hypothetical protein